jgi:transposase, IS5 family
MPIKRSQPLSFTSHYVEKRKAKSVFLKQIAQLIEWDAVASVLTKCSPTRQSGQGRKAYPLLVLLKMALLQTWYQRSDYWCRRTSQ